MDQANNIFFKNGKDAAGITSFDQLGARGREFPYKTVLNLQPFASYLRRRADGAGASLKAQISCLLLELEEAQVLLQPLENKEVLAEKKHLFQQIMETFFPLLHKKERLGYLSTPFAGRILYATEELAALLGSEDRRLYIDMEERELADKMVFNACQLILHQFYDYPRMLLLPASVVLEDDKTGLSKYYDVQLDPRFTTVELKGALPGLEEAYIQSLLQRWDQREAWLSVFPPERFQFSGIFFLQLVEVTRDRVLSTLKDYLLEPRQDPIAAEQGFLEQQLKVLFQRPTLRMGIAGLDDFFRRMISLPGMEDISLLGRGWHDLLWEMPEGSVYERAANRREAVIVSNLEKWPTPALTEQRLQQAGIRSLIIVPVMDDEQRVVAFMEIGDFQKNSFAEDADKLVQEFSLLLQMGALHKRKELENRIRDIIQGHFTSLHPSVDWKFREAAMEILHGQMLKAGTESGAPDISFHGVYPLYGQADIVASSAQRNEAIRTDLIANLQLCASLLADAFPASETLLADFYRRKVERLREGVEKSFSSTDESLVLEVLSKEVHPYLRQLQRDFQAQLGMRIETYFGQLDARLGLLYQHRKDYEESVTAINQMISAYLEEEEARMQKVLPHYFEKFRTDGVEYNLYLGEALLKNGSFAKSHLQEFQLWQLITMCEITRRVAALRETLPVPLTTAQLIFVYGDTLDIRFRLDEKRFDVDGAYNVRYEILKKRIDKAYLENSRERLTQSGKVAIVYLQDKDRQEYLTYLRYLQEKQYIHTDIEDLKLGKLQGVEGLRALRVRVKEIRKQ